MRGEGGRKTLLLFPLPKEQGNARKRPRAGTEQRAVPWDMTKGSQLVPSSSRRRIG